MFDLSNYSDYDKWLDTFAEASARLDALQTAVIDVRHLLRGSEGVHSAEILEVLERTAYNHSSIDQPGRSHADD